MSTGDDPASDELPRPFGRYQLFDRIGEGGMARIYLARTQTDLGAQRLVVVKQILPMLSDSAEFSKLLVDEAKLAAQLSHGNITQVIDLGRADDQLFIAMEYVEGFDLRELLKRCSRQKVPLPLEFSLHIVMETLRGLDYAHRKKGDEGTPLGIVHRDVSPSNVLVSFEGEVKLCDFGIARAIGAAADVPADAIQGKAGYMSPEAAKGDPADVRSDVFSMGIILWELVSGRRLYRGVDKSPPTLAQAQEAVVPALQERGHPSEDVLHGIVMRALAKDPRERFDSARTMLREIEDYVGSAGVSASPLRLGEWVTEHFGADLVATRRARERAARALELGPPLSIRPIEHVMRDASPPPPPSQKLDSIRFAPIEPPPPSLQAMVRPLGRDENRGRGFLPWVLLTIVVVLVGALLALR